MASKKTLIRSHGLKYTLPRHAILEVLTSSQKPLSVTHIRQILRKKEQSVGVVTIYRVVEALERVGLAHQHRDGSFSACLLPDLHCGHTVLHCSSCGNVRETHDHALCKKEESVARRMGFHTLRSMREVEALCSSCVS